MSYQSWEDFVSRLKIGHESIALLLDQIQLKIRFYHPAKIHELEAMLFKHFELQNKKFYEQLVNIYRQDQKILKLLEFLSVDLRDLKIQTVMFMDAYCEPITEIKKRNFSREFLVFSKRIKNRVDDETDYLIPILLNSPTEYIKVDEKY